MLFQHVCCHRPSECCCAVRVLFEGSIMTRWTSIRQHILVGGERVHTCKMGRKDYYAGYMGGFRVGELVMGHDLQLPKGARAPWVHGSHDGSGVHKLIHWTIWSQALPDVAASAASATRAVHKP